MKFKVDDKKTSSVWQHVKASRTVLLILIVPLALLPLPLVVNESVSNCEQAHEKIKIKRL